MWELNRITFGSSQVAVASQSFVTPKGTSRFPEIRTRNLIYHVYPNPAKSAWKANLRQIKKRWSLFNGKRIIAVATDKKTASVKDVRAEMSGYPAEYIEIRNDPRLREVASFPLLLEMVQSLDHHEASFYAHGKGASNGRDYVDKNTEGIVYWRNAMYHRLLDFWDEVHARLRTHPIVGTLKTDWSDWIRDGAKGFNFWPSGLYCGSWMFAGTYYWFRHDLTFSNPNAMHPADDIYGTESWPAKLWPPEKGATVYQPWPPEQDPNPDFYLAATHAPEQGWDRIADEQQ